jgi:antitoxin (DNA-binding transcriptional repressor) of toxin-antitoxin stability system
MPILFDVKEAAERFDELIERTLRGEVFVICRGGIPIAELTAIPKAAGTMDHVRALAAEGRASVPPGASSNHDEFYDEHGLPK